MVSELENYELDLLLQAIKHRWGYDFHGYARSSITRRVKIIMMKHQVQHVSELIPRVLHDAPFFQDMVKHFSITVTEMFRDPDMWYKVVEDIFPRLKSWSYFKIWHAACATGEEVWSMAILLKEAGLLERATIYATDFNDIALHQARQGIYTVRNMQTASASYFKAGGKQSLSDYYTSYSSNEVIFDKTLSNRIVWANHNLATDRSFGEMNLIMCRNVLIYFTPELQNMVLSLFTTSLSRGGFLCLGGKESLNFSSIKNCYTPISLKERIWQKKSVDDIQDTLVFPEKTTSSMEKKLVNTRVNNQVRGIVAIGCSMGGLQALQVILTQLTSDFPLPIIITQHLSPLRTSVLAEILQRYCALTVKDAEANEAIKVGNVYIAPPDCHLVVTEKMTISLSSDTPQLYARPSINVMFDSVANVFGENAIGVVLTGANEDGAEGLLAIRNAGGWAIIENPETAHTAFMPKIALRRAGADCVAPVEEIAMALNAHAKLVIQNTEHHLAENSTI